MCTSFICVHHIQLFVIPRAWKLQTWHVRLFEAYVCCLMNTVAIWSEFLVPVAWWHSGLGAGVAVNRLQVGSYSPCCWVATLDKLLTHVSGASKVYATWSYGNLMNWTIELKCLGVKITKYILLIQFGAEHCGTNSLFV